jgi:uncharacterized membrane protein
MGSSLERKLEDWMKSLARCQRDLLVSLAVTMVLAVLLTVVQSQVVHVVSGMLMVFLMPGHLLIGFLWPCRGQLDNIWRLTLIVPLSIALVGGLLLLVHYFWTYEYERVIVLLALVSGSLAILGFLRCRGVSSARRRRSTGPSFPLQLVQSYRPTGWHAVLGFSFLVLLGAIVYAAVTPRQIPTLTEFYVLTEDGHLPLSTEDVRDSHFILKYGIANHEGKITEYSLGVFADTAEGSTQIASESVTVPEGSTVEGVIDVSSKPPGTQALRLLLYLPDRPEPYRSLRMVLSSDEWP